MKFLWVRSRYGFGSSAQGLTRLKRGNSSLLGIRGSFGCWQSSFPCGHMTNILIFLLASDWELLLAPRSHLKSLAAWPSQAIHSMAVCFLPGQPELVSLKGHLWLKVYLIRSGPPRILSHLMVNWLVTWLWECCLILFTGPVHTQEEGLRKGMHWWETCGHFRIVTAYLFMHIYLTTVSSSPASKMSILLSPPTIYL